VPEPDVWVSTDSLNRIVEHNAGDLTAILEAGVRLADAQAVFAEAGQMLALDPPLGAADGATIGGIVATADSGPLRHRYGAPRDLLLGVTAALPDGTVATAGGKVIKNVAGYDLAKLFAGSYGTLGAIVRVVLRLHPRPARTATAVVRSGDPASLARTAQELAHAPLELECLDVSWAQGEGAVLARFGGVAAAERARRIAAEVHEEDDALWAAQREGQRSTAGVVVRVSALPSELERVLHAAARSGGTLVGRAALGVSWIQLPAEAGVVRRVRARVDPFPCVLLDGPPAVRRAVDPWGTTDEALRRLSHRVKERFDPAGVLSPGVLG
jgi:glycolate oxidase FAD binding subunit